MEKPNVIFLMTDQQRWDCLGKINRLVQTPALDALAEKGILFDQAVCQCPMCVPSRNSLLYGMYPFQTGVRTNGGGITEEDRQPAKPLPQLMADSGYLCAGFGKTHWGHGDGKKPASSRGFHVRAEGQPRSSTLCEENAVMMDDEDPKGMADYFKEVESYGSGEENWLGYLGCTSKVPAIHHRDGFIFKKAMEFLDNPPEDKPLFLYLSFIKPHAGFNVPPEFEDLYNIEDIPDMDMPPWDEEPDTHVRAMAAESEALSRIHRERKASWKKLTSEQRRRSTLRYFANCTMLDSYIGQVLNKASEKGLLDNTLIVFCSDHGDMMGERDYRFSKYCLYDSSVRVPLIISGNFVPVEKKGTVDRRPAGLIDIVPTICSVAGIEQDPRLPGYSLLSEKVRKGAFCEFHGGGPEPVHPAPALMWRTAEYKLITFREGSVLDETQPKGELYDLENDPKELHNLFDNPEYMSVRLTMTEALLSHIAAAVTKGPMYWEKSGVKRLTKANE